MVGLPFCHRPPCLRRDSWNVNKQEPTIEENIRRGNTRIGESPRHDATDDEDYAFGRWSIKFDGSHERARSAFEAGLSSWTIDRNASATDSGTPLLAVQRRDATRAPFPPLQNERVARRAWSREEPGRPIAIGDTGRKGPRVRPGRGPV